MMTNCPKCGKIFVRTKRPICDKCYKEDEEAFEVTRLYLKDNPSANMEILIEETGATKKQIMRWIRDGRLDKIDGLDVLKCSKCGKTINHGRVCLSCVAKLQNEVKEMGASHKVEKKKSNIIKVTDRK